MLTLPLKWEPSRGGDLFHLYVKWKLMVWKKIDYLLTITFL